MQKRSDKPISFFADSSRARQRSAAEQMKQHRFRLVLRVVRRGYHVRLVFGKQHFKRAVPCVSRRLFDARTVLFCKRAAIERKRIQRNVQRIAEFCHKRRVLFAAFAAKPVFYMHRGKKKTVRRRHLVQIMQQT